MAKHSTIYPSSQELEAVQTLVSTVECALKHVSDWMDHSNSDAHIQVDSQPADSTEEDNPGDKPSEETEDSSDSYRWSRMTNTRHDTNDSIEQIDHIAYKLSKSWLEVRGNVLLLVFSY